MEANLQMNKKKERRGFRRGEKGEEREGSREFGITKFRAILVLTKSRGYPSLHREQQY